MLVAHEVSEHCVLIALSSCSICAALMLGQPAAKPISTQIGRVLLIALAIVLSACSFCTDLIYATCQWIIETSVNRDANATMQIACVGKPKLDKYVVWSVGWITKGCARSTLRACC